MTFNNKNTYVSKISPVGINTVTLPSSGVLISADEPAKLKTSPTNITFLPTNVDRLFPKTRGNDDYRNENTIYMKGCY